MVKTKLKLMTFADVILILIILMGAIFSYVYMKKDRADLQAYIYYRNSLIGTYELSKTQIIRINENCSAEIKDGKINMSKSDCPDKRCVKQGWSDLLPIICLPNQIVIEIKNNKAKQEMHLLH
jgi:hypothetical protein